MYTSSPNTCTAGSTMRGWRASLANGFEYRCAAKLVRTASLPFSRTFSGRRIAQRRGRGSRADRLALLERKVERLHRLQRALRGAHDDAPVAFEPRVQPLRHAVGLAAPLLGELARLVLLAVRILRVRVPPENQFHRNLQTGDRPLFLSHGTSGLSPVIRDRARARRACRAW